MTVKSASLLALIGTILLSILLVIDVFLNLLSLSRGLIPAVTMLTSLIYAFASASVAVFFLAFHRSQS